MRSRNNVLLFLFLAVPASASTFAVIGAKTTSWPAILSSVGHVAGPPASADIVVAPANTPNSAIWQARVQAGTALILEGPSPLAAAFGFKPGTDTVPIIHVVDVHNPALPVIWAKSLEVPKTVDSCGRIGFFAKDRWSNQPVVAGFKLGGGAVLWVAAPPGPSGYERFPYLMQSLADLGFEPSFRASGLWAFFDYSYRTRADPDYLAARWRKAGIAALHVASWHFFRPG